MRPIRRSPMGQRQEVQILLPSALLIMAVLSTFALFAYRNTVQLLIETRQAEALRMGRQLAGEIARGPLPSGEVLRQRLPTASAVTVFNDKGEQQVSFGTRAMTPAANTSGGWFMDALLRGGDLVSARVSFERGGRSFSLQVDLPAPVLRSRQRGFRILTPVVLLINGAITVWVLFFLRWLLAPFDRLVEQARSAGQEMTGSQDEVAFLMETFEKALEALSSRESDRFEALQGTLERSLAQLGELTAGVAHELRNSLATLRGYLGLMERDPEDALSTEYLKEIRRESDHLARVLEDFLTFARPGSVRGEEVDLAGLAHRAAADPALAGAAVSVRPTAPGEELMVWGDAQLLERALRNVVSNAVEAQAEAGVQETVEIVLTARQGGTEIAILDRGPGVAPEIREKLFEPFFTGRPGGVGMGLALTRRIVLLHAGSITLEPRARGGTRAQIWLPAGKPVTKGNDSSNASSPEQAVGKLPKR